MRAAMERNEAAVAWAHRQPIGLASWRRLLLRLAEQDSSSYYGPGSPDYDPDDDTRGAFLIDVLASDCAIDPPSLRAGLAGLQGLGLIRVRYVDKTPSSGFVKVELAVERELTYGRPG